jgi:thiol-disulfide isomerase/thioredoxin
MLLLAALLLNAVSLFPATKPTVLIFIRTDCPISNRYAPELQRLYREYSSRIAFYLVYADPSESAKDIQKHMSDYGYKFDALRDPGHDLVKLAKARVTPEAALFSARGDLLYHGRIDDLYVDLGKSKREATTHDLQDAIDAVLAGKPVAVPETRAAGCFLSDIQ